MAMGGSHELVPQGTAGRKLPHWASCLKRGKCERECEKRVSDCDSDFDSNGDPDCDPDCHSDKEDADESRGLPSASCGRPHVSRYSNTHCAGLVMWLI